MSPSESSQKTESQFNSSHSKDSKKPASICFEEIRTEGMSGNNVVEDTDEENLYNLFELLAAAAREFIFWWFWAAIILAIPLSLSATTFRTARIKDVRLFGFFCWLVVSWLGLLVSYLIAWCLAYLWYSICHEEWIRIDDYDTFFVDIRRSVMLLLWGFISWATVPLLCQVNHHHCTTGWVPIFQRAMLATLVVDILFFAKDFLLE